MARTDGYTDLKGCVLSLRELDGEERKLIARLKRRARSHRDWNDFENYWTKAVGKFYAERGMSRAGSRRSVPYRIGQDLGNRLAIETGMAQPRDYRDELDELIRSRFGTRREFCRSTGLSEDMVSHVLSRRKHLSLEALTTALGRIGYSLRIMPLEQVESAS